MVMRKTPKTTNVDINSKLTEWRIITEEDKEMERVWRYIYAVINAVKGKNADLDYYYNESHGSLYFDIPVSELYKYNKYNKWEENKLNELLYLLDDGIKTNIYRLTSILCLSIPSWYKKNHQLLYELMESYRATKRGIAVMAGAKSPKKSRRTLPIPKLIRYLIRKNPKGTTADLWSMIPRDMIGGIRIHEHKFYRNGERLLALGKVDGCIDMRPVGKPLKFSAFKKRVGKERKPPAR